MEFLQNVFTALVLFLTGVFGTGAVLPAERPVFEPEYAEVVSVIDGDTIVADIGGTEEFVRYIGVNTPEHAREENGAECFSAEATAANAALVAGKRVWLERDEDNRDRYNRLLRYVHVGDTSVNEALVAGGYAVALPIAPNTKHAREFYELQQQAKEVGAGLWKACFMQSP